MKIILLSGGSGKRLWPLSNDTRSKQFLKLLRNEQGNLESMVQRIYRQIRNAGIHAEIVIATSASQVESIRNQLGDTVEIVQEPERRDTFPAIALACSYLLFKKKVNPCEVIITLPVDPYADLEYFKLLLSMEEAVENGAAKLVLMGIRPSYPSAKYGYILPAKALGESPENESEVFPVERFIEKPSEEAARKLIEEGAVWNGGVFAFRLGYLMDIIKNYTAAAGIRYSYKDIQNNYARFVKTSFDYEVAEKVSSVAMLLYHGFWKDLGTWNMLAEEMGDNQIGRVTLGEGNFNTVVVNELSIPVIALGLKDIVIAAGPDGILVTDKNKSSYLKPYVDSLNERPMAGESIWGEYVAFDYNQYEDKVRSLTKHLTVKAGRYINYQAHRIRDEILTIVSGRGDLVIDGEVKNVSRGDVFYIAKGQKHSIKAQEKSDLHYIEVQIGTELVEEDNERFEWQW